MYICFITLSRSLYFLSHTLLSLSTHDRNSLAACTETGSRRRYFHHRATHIFDIPDPLPTTPTLSAPLTRNIDRDALEWLLSATPFVDLGIPYRAFRRRHHLDIGAIFCVTAVDTKPPNADLLKPLLRGYQVRRVDADALATGSRKPRELGEFECRFPSGNRPHVACTPADTMVHTRARCAIRAATLALLHSTPQSPRL